MAESERKKRTEDNPEHFRRMIFRGWFIVCGIAVAFVLYGLFAFFVIGDREPADWDFGEIEDTPGQSVHSTYPYRGVTEDPETQHVDRKTPDALTDIADNPLPKGIDLRIERNSGGLEFGPSHGKGEATSSAARGDTSRGNREGK
jgi:hypothetical protein